MQRGLGIAVVLSISAAVAQGAAPEQAAKRLAVLEFTGNTTSPTVKVVMSDEVRGGVLEAVRGTNISVMAHESMQSITKDNGGTSCPTEGLCEVEVARTIGADLVVTGDVALVDGQLRVSLKLFEVGTGKLLASKLAKGTTQSEVLDAIQEVARALMTDGLSPDRPVVPTVEANRRSVKSTAATKAVGDVYISTTPRDGVRLEITDPSGKVVLAGVPFKDSHAAIGRWRVLARATGYQDTLVEFQVVADELTPVRFDLRPLGGLRVIGTPMGAAVTVTGPGGFQDSGGLPWEATGLLAGSYQVEVKRDSYRTWASTVEVRPGQPTVVELALVREAAVAEPGPKKTHGISTGSAVGVTLAVLGALTWAITGALALQSHEHAKTLLPGDPTLSSTVEVGKALMYSANGGAGLLVLGGILFFVF